MEDTNYVYILRSGNSNNFKIGVSKNIEKRIKQFQTGSPYKISTYCYFEAPTRQQAFNCEYNLHKFFDSHKTDLMWGEWYRISKKELEQLTKCQTTIDVMYWLINTGWKERKSKKENKSKFLENW